MADALSYSLAYNFDTDPHAIYRAAGTYTQSAAQLYFTDNPDLSAFKAHGGKLMLYQGGSDSSLSMNDLLKWYNAMNQKMGGNAQDFARLYLVPGMKHCSGGPATDKFNMLPQLVSWVEQGVAPDSVIAAATNPGYFNAASRTRPLCPYPKQSRYKGSAILTMRRILPVADSGFASQVTAPGTLLPAPTPSLRYERFNVLLHDRTALAPSIDTYCSLRCRC